MEIKNIFLFVKKNKTEKIKQFGVIKQEKEQIDLDTRFKISDILPVHDNDNTTNIDDLLLQVNKYVEHEDLVRVLHFLGVLDNEESDIKYNCYEIDCTQIEAKNIEWYNTREILNVQNSILLSLVFRLFFRYYFKAHGGTPVSNPEINSETKEKPVEKETPHEEADKKENDEKSDGGNDKKEKTSTKTEGDETKKD